MSTNTIWKQVTKEEFYAFINSYPAKLHLNTTNFCTPALCSYNDFSRGNWPESVVAGFFKNEDLPDEWNAGENEYLLLRELCP